MSCLTITNLGRGKAAAVCRMVSTIYWIIAHTITFTVILVICNTDPGIVNYDFGGGPLVINWSELPLVQDLSTLNILLVSTLCLGWLALVLDVITAAAKYRCCRPSDNNKKDQDNEASFWDGAIFLEGLKKKYF